MSLDAFMAEHTSEDNASFSEILEGINKRKRERYQWLHGQIEQKQVQELLAICQYVLSEENFHDGFATCLQLCPWLPHIFSHKHLVLDMYFQGVNSAESDANLQGMLS